MGTASASVTYQSQYPRIFISNETPQSTYDTLVAAYGINITNSHILEEVAPHTWLFKCQVLSETTGPSPLVIINETVMFGNSLSGYSFKGRIYAENATIVGFSGTNYSLGHIHDNTEKGRVIKLYGSGVASYDGKAYGIRNTVFKGITLTEIGSVSPAYKLQDSNWYNVTWDNCYYGIIGQTAIENVTFNNFTFQNLNPVFGYGIRKVIIHNSTLNNINAINVGEYTGYSGDDATGSYGFQISGNNNIANNLYVNGSRYSGYNIGGSNWTGTNWTAIRTHHNAMELQFTNSTIDGLMIQNNTIHGLFSDVGFEDPFDPVANNIFKNLTIYDTGSGYAIYQGRVFNTLFQNAILTGNAIDVQYGTNITFTNISHLSGTTGFVIDNYGNSPYNYSENIKIINSVFSGINQILYSSNVSLVNSHYNSLSGFNDADYSLLYPLNVLVTNTTGYPVDNAELTVTANTFSINGLGQEVTTAHTDITGKLNESELIYVADFLRDSSSGFIYYSPVLTASKDNEQDVILDISPDPSWYREDPNIPTYTITAILPDEATNGPHITGFAPSEDNPFTAGESKKFQVWSDETLTTMKWYVNGNPMSSGSMEYVWEVESGTNTIMFTGSNANGAVVQTWEVTEGEEVPVESPVSSGTGLSFTPSATSLIANTGESTTFTVDSGQEFTSALWYRDGSLVESGSTTHVENWDTAGTHTVRFDGTAVAGTISRTWTTVVSEPVVSEYSSISISPSASTVAPGESFSLDVYIDPAQSLTGSQFDLHYSQLASVSSVDEGGLFSPNIFATTFEYGRIDNTLGILSQVYSAIVGSGTISQAGVMATVDMVAGSDSGVLELELANVILSDASSNPAAYAASYATVLVDTAPEFTSISAKSVDEAQSLSFIVSATDADEDDLTYTAISLPSGASFDAGTATFSWTPSEGDSGNYEAVFEVTDGYLTDTVSVSITVTPLNHVPIISLFEPADNSVFEEGSTINVNVVASDEDGQSLSYVIKVDGSQVSTASSYAWETGYESAGTHTIEVTVSDGIDEVSSSGTITITDLQPRWDVNEDGIVNVLDITLVGQNYGTTYTSDYPRWDVNLDGIVNIQDLSIVAGHFGETV